MLTVTYISGTPRGWAARISKKRMLSPDDDIVIGADDADGSLGPRKWLIQKCRARRTLVLASVTCRPVGSSTGSSWARPAFERSSIPTTLASRQSQRTNQ
ncbi:hypothetical protein EVG20_g10812, partial [Dentipellis fragilis]